jgi:transglutaminase-like putative cysteine protease
MKRRDFLAATAALLAGQALAAPKHKAAAKVTYKKATAKGAKAGLKRAGKASLRAKPVGPVAGLTNMPLVHGAGPALRLTDPPLPPWRELEVISEASLPLTNATTTLWLPLPIEHDTSWQRGIEMSWSGNFTRAGIVRDSITDLTLFRAEWPAGKVPLVQVSSRIAVRDRQFDVTRRGQSGEREEVLRRFLRPTPDSAVRDQAEHIIGRIREPMPQARAVYDWLLEKGSDDSEVARLKGNLGIQENGYEALAKVFVGLCRSLEIPARVVAGLRLEANASLHYRAEYYAPYYGWIPVDPADAAATHNESARRRMFGYWEMNWLALSRGAEQAPTGSNMPSGTITGAWAESGGKPVDGLTYRVSSKRS